MNEKHYNTRNRPFSLWLVICVSCFLYLVFILSVVHFHVRPPFDLSGGIVRSFPYDQIDHYLRPYGFSGLGKVGDWQRTMDFDGLIIRGVDGNKPGGSAWIIKNGLVRKSYCPNGIPYVDREGNIFAWGTTDAVFVASGSRFAVQDMRRYVALDPEGKYVLVAEKTGRDAWRSWIQATNLAGNEVWACNDALCDSLARAAGKLFVSGAANQGHPVCFILNELGEKLIEERRVDLESGQIQDVDPDGKNLLIFRDAGPFSSLLIYNIQSGRSISHPLSPEFSSFFLKSDPFVTTNPITSSNRHASPTH